MPQNLNYALTERELAPSPEGLGGYDMHAGVPDGFGAAVVPIIGEQSGGFAWRLTVGSAVFLLKQGLTHGLKLRPWDDPYAQGNRSEVAGGLVHPATR